MSLKPYHHIHLSPHYADAALSCGGAIHQQIVAGQAVLVLTICAAPPPPDAPLSPFAQQLHNIWATPGDVVAARRAEDKAAMEVLGVDYQLLDFTDCIYRGLPEEKMWYYNSNSDLFSQIHPTDLSLKQELSHTIARFIATEAIIYAPLAVGHHVDHQLTHAAALELRRQGYTVVFYEDYPYSDPNYPFTRAPLEIETKHTLAATLAGRQHDLQAELRELSPADLQAKLDSVRAYASQLSMLFGGETAMEEYITKYTSTVGHGQPAERIWRLID